MDQIIAKEFNKNPNNKKKVITEAKKIRGVENLVDENIIFISPQLQQSINGGSKMLMLGFDLNNKKTEAAYLTGNNGKCGYLRDVKNMLFSDFFDANRRFFDNYSSDSYPFEICIREETQNDVIKVHPKRSYKTTNRIVEKNKWIYVFDTEKGQKMVYGNTCKDRAELKKYIDQLRYGRAMNHIRVYKNDSYTIPAGTMYGFNKGMLYFQVENPSDNVYNIYDYDRENEILDTTDAINCADVPFISENIPQISKNKLSLPQFNIRIINTLFFKTCKFKNARWLQVYVVSGKGTLNWKYKIKKGDCFIVNSNIKKLFIVGRVKAIVTYINEQNIPQQLLNK